MMKSMFWFACVVLIAAISCNSPKKTETLPGPTSENTKVGESSLVQAITGTYTLKTGVFHGLSMRSNITDVTLKLCPNGKFLMRYASPETDWGSTSRGMSLDPDRSTARGIPQRGTWDATEKTRIRGTWHIEGTPAKGKLTLIFRKGNVETYVYEVKQKGWLNFNSADFWRVGSAHCR